ncbi:Peptidylprolyl isomerase [Lentibacillus sp. JNUCC-1]|uniref:SurA N-terminal domain-containing protein n=1 Tax=Lentibacillus sp. JNUCC-1 TaxID=2654513 RepID=UPI0012E939AC|nr:SurA N-terminal domain-containing protein [Lentibacillus sp. JNUCC-1]MUV36491.1 Peptidylprolyl isomerase [Lentibacillus sp. JNUCC-1]
MKKKLLFVLFASLVVLLSACGGDGNDSDKGNESKDGGEEKTAEPSQEMPEPDLENIPDVVAEVNGEEISKGEFESLYTSQFQSAAAQAQMSGQELDQEQLKSQVAEGLIGQRLVIQEAENRGLEATDEAIEDTLNSIIERNGFESKEQLMEGLESQEIDKEEFMSEVATQAKVDQLLAKESGNLEPTEEEVKEAYEGMKKQQEVLNSQGEEDGEDAPEIPSFEDIKPQLKEKLYGQNEQEAYQKLIDQLREKGDVKNHLS